ncbi:MAG: cysteine desulfurase family protein [bacterium]
MQKRKIYLDHSATTPVDPKVLASMMPYFCESFGNASSLHTFGEDALKAIEIARDNIAKFLNCKNEEVIFTSGATESDNMAIFGVARALKRQYPDKKLHIITTQIEHPAVLEPCKRIEQEGFEVTYLPVSKNGIVNFSEFQKSIKDNTALVSMMYVNNEVGTIQPIKEIGDEIERINNARDHCSKKNCDIENCKKLPHIYFHTDAVQAAGYCDCDVKKLKVDLLSISGHKIYGPKGVGALYMKNGVPFLPIMVGGHQEKSKRPGTYNSAGIVGLGKAIELLQSLKYKKEILKIKKLRDYLISQALKKIPDSKLNGDLENRVEGNANFSLIGAEGESMLIMLDMEGVAVSTGSACSSGSLKPSHVLLAMDIPPEICHNSLRITLGKFTTKDEIDRTVKALVKTVKKLRDMAPK